MAYDLTAQGGTKDNRFTSMEPKLARAGMETYAMITTVEIEWMRTAFARAQAVVRPLPRRSKQACSRKSIRKKKLNDYLSFRSGPLIFVFDSIIGT